METPRARTGRPHRCPSRNRGGPGGEGHEPECNMHVGGEADGCVTASQLPDNSGQPLAEGMEGRQPTKENIGQATSRRTQSRISELSDLHGVRRAARKDKQMRFTALLHHVTIDLLRDSYYAL